MMPEEETIYRKPFDLQEAVVLLDVYLLEKKNKLSKTKASEIASSRLRDLAAKRGMVVADSFRSPIGIQKRLMSIGGVFEGKESSSAPGTEVFREAVALYRSDREKYQKILSDAGLPSQDTEGMEKKKTNRIKHTKFVNVAKDQTLKEKYSKSFNDVYYALKNLSRRADDGVTATDVFLRLDRQVKRKDIIDILSKASWSKEVTSGHYAFYDKKKEKREKQKMDEALKKAENDLFEWLPSVVPPHVLEDVKDSYGTVSSLLIKKKVLRQPLIATTQIGQVENALKQVTKLFRSKRMCNNATRLLSAYLTYLREIKNKNPENTECSNVEIKEDWIRFDFTNSQAFGNTSPVYCNLDGTVIEERTWNKVLVAIVEHEIANDNPAVQMLYKKSLNNNKVGRPFLMKNKIEGQNCAKLSNGYWINVNWNSPQIMRIIQSFCLHCGYNKNQVALYGAPKENVPARRKNTSSKKNIDRGFDMEKAESVLKGTGLQGATAQELIDAAHLSTSSIATKNALEQNLNVIAMPNNRYVHVDSVVDLDEAEEILNKILKTHFSQFGGYSNNQLLYGAASQELSMFLNDNDCENIDAVYAIARFLFEKRAVDGKPYKFSPPHIFESEPDYPMTLRGLMINLARNNGGILYTEDAKSYLQKIMVTYIGLAQLLQINNSNTFLMYEDDKYLLSEALEIDDAWCQKMHDQIDALFRNANIAYVIPRDISTAWLKTLPALPHNLEWTYLLLQEIIDKYPAIGFQSISADLNQPYHTIAAAFVPIGSPLQSFPDIVSLFMEERHNLPMKMLGEELRLELKDAGMLEANEMINSMPKALADYRFAWTDNNKYVYVRGNK